MMPEGLAGVPVVLLSCNGALGPFFYFYGQLEGFPAGECCDLFYVLKILQLLFGLEDGPEEWGAMVEIGSQ